MLIFFKKFSNLFGIATAPYEKEEERPLIRKSSKITYREDTMRNLTAEDMWSTNKDPFDYGKNSFNKIGDVVNINIIDARGITLFGKIN